MKRRIYFILIASLAMIFFTGGVPTEIAEKTIIGAIGIDCDGEECTVTMQYFRPDGSGSETAIDPSMPNVGIVKGKGKTVKEAVEKCRSQLSGEMYIGKNRMIVFGIKTDLSDIDKLMDGLIDDPECYCKQDCAAASGTAEKLLETPVQGGAVASERYPQMIDSGIKNGSGMHCTLDELYTAMKQKDGCMIMPVFSAEKPEKKNNDSGGSSESPQAEIKLEEYAVYKNGRYLRPESCEDIGIISAVRGRSSEICIDRVSRKILSKNIRAGTKDGRRYLEVTIRLKPKDRYDRESEKKAAAQLKERGERLFKDLNNNVSPSVTGTDDLVKKHFTSLFRGGRHLTNPPDWYIIVL